MHLLNQFLPSKATILWYDGSTLEKKNTTGCSAVIHNVSFIWNKAFCLFFHNVIKKSHSVQLCQTSLLHFNAWCCWMGDDLPHKPATLPAGDMPRSAPWQCRLKKRRAWVGWSRRLSMCYHLAGENVLVLSDNVCLRALHIIALQDALLLFLWL